MSSKDVKGLLKEAREAIKNKDFQASLKLCKAILRDDKENYMALVFLGLSLQDAGPVDQAPNAFRKAIQISPTNVLAWNGLLNYYEKLQDEEAKKELVQIYVSLLEIETNDKKLGEYCEKLSNLPVSVEKFAVVTEAVIKVAKNENRSYETVTIAWSSVISIISKIVDVPASILETYEEALLFILNNSKSGTRQHYAEYLKLLYKRDKYETLFEAAEKMYELYDTDLTSLEWICKVYNELVIEEDSLVSSYHDKIEKHCDNLLKIQNNSSIGLFTRATVLFEQKNFLESKELLKQVTSLRPGLVHAWVLLASCGVKLHIFNEALNAASKADKLLESINNSNQVLRRKLDLLLMEALSRDYEEENLKRGVDICTKLLGEDALNPIILSCLVRCYINLENYSQAKLNLSKLKQTSNNHLTFTLLSAQLLHKQGNFEKAAELLQTESNADSSEWWFEVGIIYWKLKQYEKSLVPFLKAAKQDPNCYVYFLHLGNYYQQFNDADKARRCYEKAFRINQRSIEAAVELSKIYRMQKNWEANVALLQNVTGGILDTQNQWAWVQLGLNYLAQEDYVRAIDTLRFVVRANPTNSYCWESLADAYMARGAYTSALKSYQKAVEIASKSLYPLLQVANIKQALGEYTEATADYESILVTNKCYVPALKGVAETCIYQARQHRKNQLIGLARDRAEYALDMLTIGIQQRNDLACLWKLAGDSCSIVASLPEKYCCMLVLAALAEGQPIEGNKALERDEIYVLAERFYYKALSLVQDNVLIWHDLAACFLSHACNSLNSKQADQLFAKAANVIQHCVSTNPGNWQHWNLMGVIAVKREPVNYALAQHSFIKAVTVEDNSAVAWCNLGTLYLILGNLKLANQAFSQAQRADPNYLNSWIGQAFIAESVGLDDAMDLFRHSTQLGYQHQGAIGYGHWVCRTLLEAPPHTVLYSIHNMHAVAVACDALTWYTENNPEDPCSWNTLGLLKERMGLKAGAAQAFRNALRLSEGSHRDKCRVNYGRLLFKLQKYGQAVDMYKDVREATFNSGSGLALSLFKDKQYEESYETYEQALHWLTDEQALQSDLLVALASMAYMFQGPDAAKTLLFQSTQLKPPSPYGLYATLSLGLLHKDLNLSKLVLKELHSLRDNPQCLPHYAILLCNTYLLEGKLETAVRELSKLVHRHPNYASLWLSLSVLLVRLYKHRPSSVIAAGKCAQLAIKLGRTNMDVTKVLSVIFLASYLTGDYEQALKAAQKAVHCYPDVSEGWIALISVLKIQLEKSSKIFKMMWLEKLPAHVKQHLNASSPVLKWLNEPNLVERIQYINTGNNLFASVDVEKMFP